MGLYEKYKQAMDDSDVDAYLTLLHDDFNVVFHKSGKSFSKDEWTSMVTGMMANDKFIVSLRAVSMRMTIFLLSIVSCLTRMTAEKP